MVGNLMAVSATATLFFVTVRRWRPMPPPPTFEDVRRALHSNYQGERVSEHNFVIDLSRGRELVQVPRGARIPPPYIMVLCAERLRVRPGKLRRPPLV